MEVTHIRKLIFVVIAILLLSGCSENGIRVVNNGKENVEKAEEIFRNDDRLKSVVALFNDKDLLAGIRVDTFSRFRKGKIEKELKKKLKEAYPELDVTVSADSKALLEASKIQHTKDKDELRKKIKKLKSLLKEET